MEGKRYDFIKVCVDKKTAEFVLNEVIKNYSKRPNWKIGKQSLIELNSGQVRVEVELTFYEKEETKSMSW